VCEDSGLIVPLGRWVLREAARHHALLVEAGWPQLSIAVNVSALQFLSGELLHDIPALIAEFELPAGFLELELTEKPGDGQSGVGDRHHARAARARRADLDRRLRHRLLLDGYLHTLPVDKLKIDRSFVDGVETNAHNAAICESILALARSFGSRSPPKAWRRGAAGLAARARLRRGAGLPAGAADAVQRNAGETAGATAAAAHDGGRRQDPVH
jgi:predicted signal transduction protein with EAL and GGDEF domain